MRIGSRKWAWIDVCVKVVECKLHADMVYVPGLYLASKVGLFLRYFDL